MIYDILKKRCRISFLYVKNHFLFLSLYLGAEKLSEGQSADALSCLHTASSLPAPRALVAYTHLLSGACLVSMVSTHTHG